jgi:hypothetical protein
VEIESNRVDRSQRDLDARNEIVQEHESTCLAYRQTQGKRTKETWNSKEN